MKRWIAMTLLLMLSSLATAQTFYPSRGGPRSPWLYEDDQRPYFDGDNVQMDPYSRRVWIPLPDWRQTPDLEFVPSDEEHPSGKTLYMP